MHAAKTAYMSADLGACCSPYRCRKLLGGKPPGGLIDVNDREWLIVQSDQQQTVALIGRPSAPVWGTWRDRAV